MIISIKLLSNFLLLGDERSISSFEPRNGYGIDALVRRQIFIPPSGIHFHDQPERQTQTLELLLTGWIKDNVDSNHNKDYSNELEKELMGASNFLEARELIFTTQLIEKRLTECLQENGVHFE